MKVTNIIIKDSQVKGYIISDNNIGYPIDIKFMLYKYHYLGLTNEGYVINKETGVIQLDDSITKIEYDSLSLADKSDMTKPYPENDEPMSFTLDTKENPKFDNKIIKPTNIKVSSREELFELLGTGTVPKGENQFRNPNEYIDPNILFEPEELNQDIVSRIALYIGRVIPFKDLKEFIEEKQITEVSKVNILKEYLKYGIPFVKGDTYDLRLTYLNSSEVEGFKIPLLSSPVSNTGLFPAIGTVLQYKQEINKEDLDKMDLVIRRDNSSNTIKDLARINTELYSDSLVTLNTIITSPKYILTLEINTGAKLEISTNSCSLNSMVFNLPRIKLGSSIYSLEICYVLNKDMIIKDYIYANQFADSLIGRIRDNLLKGKDRFNTYNIYSSMGMSPESCINYISKYYIDTSDSILSDKGLTKFNLLSLEPIKFLESYYADEDISNIYCAMIKTDMIKTDTIPEELEFKIKDYENKIKTGEINTSEILMYINNINKNLESLKDVIIAMYMSKEISVEKIVDTITEIANNPQNDIKKYIEFNKSRVLIDYTGQQSIREWSKKLLYNNRVKQVIDSSSLLYVDEVLFETGEDSRHVGIIGRQFGIEPKGGYTTKEQDAILSRIKTELLNIYPDFIEDSKLLKMNMYFIITEALNRKYDNSGTNTQVLLSLDLGKKRQPFSFPTEILDSINEYSIEVIEDTASLTTDLITYNNVYCYCINAIITPYAVVPKKGYSIPANPINIRASLDKDDDLFSKVIEIGKVVPPYRKAILRRNPVASASSGTPFKTISGKSTILKYIYSLTRKDNNGEYIEQRFIDHPYDNRYPDYKEDFNNLKLTDRNPNNQNKYIRTSNNGYILTDKFIGLNEVSMCMLDDNLQKALSNYFLDSIQCLNFLEEQEFKSVTLLSEIPINELLRLDSLALIDKLSELDELPNKVIYEDYIIEDGNFINYKTSDNSSYTLNITGNLKGIKVNGKIYYFVV